MIIFLVFKHYKTLLSSTPQLKIFKRSEVRGQKSNTLKATQAAILAKIKVKKK